MRRLFSRRWRDVGCFLIFSTVQWIARLNSINRYAIECDGMRMFWVIFGKSFDEQSKISISNQKLWLASKYLDERVKKLRWAVRNSDEQSKTPMSRRNIRMSNIFLQWAGKILEWAISFYDEQRKCSGEQSFFTMSSGNVPVSIWFLGWALIFFRWAVILFRWAVKFYVEQRRFSDERITFISVAVRFSERADSFTVYPVFLTLFFRHYSKCVLFEFINQKRKKLWMILNG